MPDSVRPFLRYDHRPVLTSACLDVSSWRLPEPEIVSVQYHDTITYPEHIAVLHDKIIVSGLDGATLDHFDNAPSVFRDYYLHNNLRDLRDLKTIHGKLMVFPRSSYLYLDNERIDLQNDTGKCVCVTPNGFVVLTLAPVESIHGHVPGMLLFYEQGVYTHMVLTPHTWQSMTWVGEREVAFAATRLLKGIAEVSLLSIDGMILKTLSTSVGKSIMGFSVLYDPVWEEYLISGNRNIMMISDRGARLIYQYDSTENSYYLYALTWQEKKYEQTNRMLLFCIRNKNLLVQMEIK
jgi:hypothetical protein